ncbi:MAG: selenocysteine-specific translation elongation factor [Chloroflexota bacterium]|nr:MAG: selenocysteine-specific translation elongation factor [Chloroflexota bacterium]
MHVIGTAGHVDHGKSTLVEALTGIDPDRLKEEKERAMTIDLGFAWMDAGEDGAEVGIVDVPGHRDFIENMLAGVGGIDLALLVIAADEGVMPQTKEHLAILDLLRVSEGVVALTKIDVVDDPDWLELVTLDALETLSDTALAEAPVVPVSAVGGQGMEQLRDTLLVQLRETTQRPDLGRPRLPIDRAFSLSGFGTIVTGTLLDGCFAVGDQIVVQPGGHSGRIRGLQTHRTKLNTARPGSRVAANLTGISKEALRRGDVVTAPGTYEATLLCDVSYRHLLEAQLPLKHNVEVKLYVGSAEIVARTRILGQRQIDAGEEGWMQLALRQPVVVNRGDRFILRRPSPASTIGGGTILDSNPGRRHRRFKPEVIARLRTLAQGSPEELLLQTTARLEPVRQDELLAKAGLPPESADVAWRHLLAEGSIRVTGEYVNTSAGWQTLTERLKDELARFHQRSPLRLGMSREELRSRMKAIQVVFNQLLDEMLAVRAVVEDRRLLRLPGHTITFSDAQQRAVDQLMTRLERQGANSLSVKDTRGLIGDDVYIALIDLGQLVQLSEDVVYTTSIYEQIVKQIHDFLLREQRIDVAQLRDLLGTSRKYAIAILEHLDDVHMTRRTGDYRQLVTSNA